MARINSSEATLIELSSSELGIMMHCSYHHDVRTTITLDEDIAAKLHAEMRRSGESFRHVVNETLRRGLLARPQRTKAPISLPVFNMGLRDGLDLDNAERLIDDLDRGILD